MNNTHGILSAAIGGLLVMGLVSGNAYAADKEECYGIAKAGKNGCNSNKSMHSCASRSKLDNDPRDFIRVPQGTCLKVGGKLERAGDETALPAEKM